MNDKQLEDLQEGLKKIDELLAKTPLVDPETFANLIRLRDDMVKLLAEEKRQRAVSKDSERLWESLMALLAKYNSISSNADAKLELDALMIQILDALQRLNEKYFAGIKPDTIFEKGE